MRRAGRGVNTSGSLPATVWQRRDRAERHVLTTAAAAFPRLAARGDRAVVGLELGVEPPIRLGDDRLDRAERRRASLRWLAGAALTGFSGVALIGAALYFDLDSQSNFADAPEFVTSAAADGRAGGGRQPRQGRPAAAARRHRLRQADLQRPDDHQGRRQGSGEGARLHASADDADPDADRLRRRGAAVQSAEAHQPGARRPTPRPIPARCRTTPKCRSATTDLTAEDASARDRRTVGDRSAGAGGRNPEGASPRRRRRPPSRLPPQLMLMRTSQAGGDPLGSALSYATVGSVSPSAPFASIEVRMIPENVTNVAQVRRRRRRLAEREAGPDAARRNLRGRAARPTARRRKRPRRSSPPSASSAANRRSARARRSFCFRRSRRPRRQADESPASRSMPTTSSRRRSRSTTRAPTRRSRPRPPRRRRKPQADDGDSGGMSLYQSLYETALKQGLPQADDRRF